MRTDDKTDLGRAKINLATYIKCLDRKKFSIELQQSPFPEAMIEFAVTATPSSSVRASTTRVSESTTGNGPALVGGGVQ